MSRRRKKGHRRLTGLLLLFAAGAPSAVQSADLLTLEDECRGRQLMIRGPVEPGDYERFVQRLKRLVTAADLPAAQDPDILWTVKLDSPGGDLSEAMRIGRFLRRALVTTEVSYRFERRDDGVYDFKRTDETLCLEGDSRLAGCFQDVQEAECRGGCLLLWLAGADRRALEGQLGLQGLSGQDAAITAYLRDIQVPAEWVARIRAGEPDPNAWLSWPERNRLSAPSDDLQMLLAGCPEPLSSAEAMQSLMTDSAAQRDALLTRAEAYRSCRAERVAEARSERLAWLQEKPNI